MAAAALIIVVSALQLLRSEQRVTGASGVRPSVFVADVPPGGGRVCQDGLSVPSGTGALELLAGTYGEAGPRVGYVLSESATGRTLFEGAVRQGWTEGQLTLPLRPAVEPAAENAQLCLMVAGGRKVSFAGEPEGVPALEGGRPASGRISVTARDRTGTSVADLAGALADRIGRGNAAWIGPWSVYAAGLLLVLGIGLGGWAVARTPLPGTSHERRVPTAARLLTAAALAVGLAWGLVTPPFQVPDETSHVAYVQYLSETGRLPIERAGEPAFSEQQRNLMGALGFARVIGRPLEQVPVTQEAEAYLRDVERQGSPLGTGNAATASPNPPLYYLLQSPLYLAASSGGLLTQLMVMRVLSVVFMAMSVLFAFLFVRELLPASPWTWTAGGLACAFQPLLGFIGSGVNPDSLLFLMATAMMYGIARALRCGLTTRRACLVALALAGGLLTKPLFFALAPIAVVGIGLAALRSETDRVRPVLAAAVCAVVPVTLVAVVGAMAFDHPYFAVATAVASGQADTAAATSSFAKQGSFMLQLFLPRLPFLADQIPGVPVQDIWINGLVGVFGWLDYSFGADAKIRGTRVFLLLLGLTAVTLVRYRASVRARLPLLVCCLGALAAVLGAVALVDYQALQSNGARFEQSRYLLPLLGLYAGLFGLAFKAFGSRIGDVALPVLWAAVSLHSVGAILLTVNRYYV